jgi:UDP-glucuronate 4-epimerase
MPMQAGDVKKTWADVDGLSEDFHYKPDCSIEKGIEQFITWYKLFYK